MRFVGSRDLWGAPDGWVIRSERSRRLLTRSVRRRGQGHEDLGAEAKPDQTDVRVLFE